MSEMKKKQVRIDRITVDKDESDATNAPTGIVSSLINNNNNNNK
jgi:hypothetical protein